MVGDNGELGPAVSIFLRKSCFHAKFCEKNVVFWFLLGPFWTAGVERRVRHPRRQGKYACLCEAFLPFQMIHS